MMKKSNTSTPTSLTSSNSRRNKNLSLLECEQCGIEIVDRPIVAMKCLHRFCSSCTTNLLSCPQCGERTAFQLDSNLATLISKINSHRGKLFAKRRILDVLQSDGADLTPPAQRWSRMGMANGRTSKSESPIKPAAQQHSVNNNSDSMVFDQQPSTSSAAFCCNGSSTSAVQTPKGSGLKAEQSSQEFDSWHKTGTPTSSHRVPLHRGLANMETIVLWPDGLNYRLKDLPQCMLRPRYLYVPAIATVAHLAEYLFKRAELEADWKYRYKYRVELMPVEEEREELSLWMNPRRDIDYLARDFKSNLQDLQGSGAPEEEYVLILRKNQEDSYFCTNLIMAHPFKPLDGHRTVGELLLATQQQMQQQQQSCRPNNGRQPTFPNGLTKPANCFGQQTAPMDGEGGPHHQQQFGAGNQLQQQLPTAAEKRPPKFVFRFVPRN